MDAELLLAHALCCSREYLLAHPDPALSLPAARRFRHLVKKRAQGVPLAYLTSHKEFFGLDFIVNKQVLIPRPETETLVELALDRLQTTDYRLRTVLIDVGTGSGCVAIAIAKSLENQSSRVGKQIVPPLVGEGGGGVTFIATDISRRALRVAKQNTARHGVKIDFLQGNLLDPVQKKLLPLVGGGWEGVKGNLIITANLPYLTEAQYQSSPSIQHEPKSALVATGNGLALYEKLLIQIQSLISNFSRRRGIPTHASGQFPVSLFMEIDPSQAPRITALIKHLLPKARVKIKPDLAGRERVVRIGIKPET